MNKFLFTISLLLLISCKRESNVTQTSVENSLIDSNWSISFYQDSDEDQTSNYQGYIFYFGEDNVLRAEKNGILETGTWSISDSNSSDDSIDGLHLNIVLYGDPLSDLTDEWDIQTYNNKNIKLIDVSGGNGGTDIVIFDKN
jgi:hypothetical protein